MLGSMVELANKSCPKSYTSALSSDAKVFYQVRLNPVTKMTKSSRRRITCR